jgi:hypothetical protein
MTPAETDQTSTRHETPGANFDEMLQGSPGAGRSTVNRRQLGLLGLVIAIAAGVAFVSIRSGPQSASGSTAAAPAGAGQISQFVAGDAQAALQIQQELGDSQSLGDGLRFSPALTQVPVTDLKTNPFRLAVTRPSPIEISGDDLTESSGSEQEREQTLRAVQSLRLQSILRGDSHRACLIDGVLYQEGDVADGFVIEEIALKTVVVRKDMYRFELQLRK